METGTCNFVSFAHACRYYKGYGFDAKGVQQKIDDGEIRLGKPDENLYVITSTKEGRYWVRDRHSDEALKRPAVTGIVLTGARHYNATQGCMSRSLHEHGALSDSMTKKVYAYAVSVLPAALRKEIAKHDAVVEFISDEDHYYDGKKKTVQIRLIEGTYTVRFKMGQEEYIVFGIVLDNKYRPIVHHGQETD